MNAPSRRTTALSPAGRGTALVAAPRSRGPRLTTMQDGYLKCET
jgi:hypothetical protein